MPGFKESIIYRFNHFFSKASLKQVSSLILGTGLAASIPMLTSPIMSRLFSIADYGLLGLYFSVTTLAGVFTSTQYAQAIITSKEDSEAKQVLWFSLSLTTIICLFYFFIVLILFLAGILEGSVIGNWLFLAPLSLFFNGITTSFTEWANRLMCYKKLAQNRVIQAVFTAIVQLTLGFIYRNEIGLMGGLITGQFTGAFLLVILFMGNKENSIGKPNTSSFKVIAVKYKSLIFFSTPTVFINHLLNQLPIIMLMRFGGITYVGNYNFTHKFLVLPQLFLSSAIFEVYKQKASVQYHKLGNCKEIFLKTFKILTLLAIVPFALIIIFAPSAYSLVFGEQWRDAGVFAQFLAIMFFFKFIINPLTYIYYIANKLKEDLMFHLVFLMITIASFYIGNLVFEDKKYLILIYSITYSVVYIFYFIGSYKISTGLNKNKQHVKIKVNQMIPG